MSRANELRQEILDLVRQYSRVKFAKKPFDPGHSLLHYAGRVFDEQEYNGACTGSTMPWDQTAVSCVIPALQSRRHHSIQYDREHALHRVVYVSEIANLSISSLGLSPCM